MPGRPSKFFTGGSFPLTGTFPPSWVAKHPPPSPHGTRPIPLAKGIYNPTRRCAIFPNLTPVHEKTPFSFEYPVAVGTVMLLSGSFSGSNFPSGGPCRYSLCQSDVSFPRTPRAGPNRFLLTPLSGFSRVRVDADNVFGSL